MVVGAKVCEITDGFLWFICGNFDVSLSTFSCFLRLSKTCFMVSLISLTGPSSTAGAR